MVKPLIQNDKFQKARQPSLIDQNKRFISVVSPTTNTLIGVWIENINSGAAVGIGGTILDFNGDKWVLDPNSGIVTANTLFKVEMDTLGVIGPNVKGAFAVGASGTIIYLDTSDNTWKLDVQGSALVPAQTLHGVLIYDINNLVIAVGTNGTILTWDGTIWTQVVVPGLTTNLFGIGVDIFSNLWACGVNGTLLKSTDFGVTWTSVPSGTTVQLNYIWFSLGKDFGYAVGGDGMILQVTPSTDTTTIIPSGLPGGGDPGSILNGFELTSDTCGFIVGNSGNIFHFDGTDFYMSMSPTTFALVDVAGTTVNVVYAVGIDGLILKLQADIYSTTIESRGTEITPLKEEFQQMQIITAPIIAGTVYTSSIFDSSRYKYVTFYVQNTFNQSISVQVMANMLSTVTGAVTVGAAFPVPATTGIESRTVVTENDGYLPYYYIVATAALLPVSGTINAYAIGRN